MDFFFNEGIIKLRDQARKIAKEKIMPVAAKHDQTEEFPWEIMNMLAEHDLFGIFVEKKDGGLGLGILGLAVATEELSRACGGITLGLAGSALGVMPILLSASEEQKKKYLPDLVSGKKLAGFAITEPEAGSDAGNIKTTAVKDGDSYILNGNKIFITNGGVAKLYTVIASTNPTKGSRGASAFIVEDGTPGFSYGKKYDKLGIRGSATCELVFEDCRVPAENLLGKEGMGFPTAVRTFDRARPGVAAQAVGIAQGALDCAVSYSREVVRGGQTIASYGAVQEKLAMMATQIEAARLLTYTAAKMIDSGSKGVAKVSAMSKLLSSEVAVSVTTEAVSIFGSAGISESYPIEKFFRDAKITQIYEGTSEIQKDVIARHLIKEAASGK